MVWHYQLFKKKYSNGKTYYQVHEVYREAPDKPIDSWTVEPVVGPCDTAREVEEKLVMILRDIHLHRTKDLDKLEAKWAKREGEGCKEKKK
ncbi:MAG: hypothetical protein GWN86_25025 [Desulfobacterales bacterium]|nr:hypothetical protein [Desulfobacterales bacterium]